MGVFLFITLHIPYLTLVSQHAGREGTLGPRIFMESFPQSKKKNYAQIYFRCKKKEIDFI